MNVKRAIKKIAALGTGATMLGATLFGASALDLGDYPEPFVVDGSFDGLIVVGEKAATTDVIGAIDVAASLQQASVTEVVVEVPGAKVETTLLGDAVKVSEGSDMLEMYELIGDVKDTLTEFDLEMLKSGIVTTNEGTTDYYQYLRFKDVSDPINSGRVVFAENELDEVGHYLLFRDGDTVFEYELEFAQGVESEIITDTNSVDFRELDDLEDEIFFILGEYYSVVDTDIRGPNSGIDGSSVADQLKIEFIGGDITDTLEEGETKTYTLDGVDYEVTVLIISDSGNNNQGTVKFLVNGEVTNAMSDGETEILNDGLEIGIREILTNEADEATGGDVVEFYLGANKLEFTDVYDDDSFASNVRIQNENIDDASVKIVGSVSNSIFKLQSIKYRLVSDSPLGDVYIAPGEGLREHLDDPEGMLNDAWDIRYEGLIDTGSSIFRLKAVGDDAYDLRYRNMAGLEYSIPFLDNSGTKIDDGTSSTQTFKFGDDDDDLWFWEPVLGTVFDNNSKDVIVDVYGLAAASDALSDTAVASGLNIFDKGLTDNDVNDAVTTGRNDYTISMMRYIFNASTVARNSSVTSGFQNGSTGLPVTDTNLYPQTTTTNTTFNRLAASVFEIAEDSYFLVTDDNDETGMTHVLSYESIDTSNQELTFTDLALGQREISYTGTPGYNAEGELIAGGNTFKVYVGPLIPKETVSNRSTLINRNSGKRGTHYPLAIDLTGDGDVNGSAAAVTAGEGKAKLIVDGGGVVDLGHSQWLGSLTAASGFTTDADSGNTLNITMTTLSSEFDEQIVGDEVLLIQAKAHTSNQVDLRFQTQTVLTGTLDGETVTTSTDFKDAGGQVRVESLESADIKQAMTRYGIFLEVTDNSDEDEADEITVEYPLSQRGPQVFITGGVVEAATTGGDGGQIVSERVNPIGVGAAVLDKDVRYDQDNMIVVGGPCINTISAELMGNPAVCTEGFEEGKAVIKFFDTGNNYAVLVAGYSAMDTTAASYVLADYMGYELAGSEVEVVATDLNDITVQAPTSG